MNPPEQMPQLPKYYQIIDSMELLVLEIVAFFSHFSRTKIN